MIFVIAAVRHCAVLHNTMTYLAFSYEPMNDDRTCMLLDGAIEANCESGQLEGYRFLFLLICAEVIVYLYEKQMLFMELEPNLRNIRVKM
uniref:Uncharacterized protein n=1 Tax=Glossina palpalis gambiensis TaxID=67801 RepID=A0A1B0C6F8_9MUSC